MYKPCRHTFKLAVVDIWIPEQCCWKNSAISFTSTPQMALSTPSLLVQFFNSFTSFLSATAQSCLWWFGKEWREREACFILPHSRTLCHAVYTPWDRDRCTAVLYCCTLSCRGNNLGNSFCLNLLLSDSLKKLLDTCAVTLLFAKAQDRKSPKKPCYLLSISVDHV